MNSADLAASEVTSGDRLKLGTIHRKEPTTDNKYPTTNDRDGTA